MIEVKTHRNSGFGMAKIAINIDSISTVMNKGIVVIVLNDATSIMLDESHKNCDILSAIKTARKERCSQTKETIRALKELDTLTPMASKAAVNELIAKLEAQSET